VVANLVSSNLRIDFYPVALLAVTAFRFTEVVAKCLQKENFIRTRSWPYPEGTAVGTPGPWTYRP
jgi:hypothetical protein